MGLLNRWRLPASVRSGLARDERVLAWAPADSQAVVVTNLGVWLPGRAERLGWHQVHKASWSQSQLTVIGSVEVGHGDGYTVMADDEAISVPLTRPGDVPIRVRERVTKSVAYTSHHTLPGGGVRVVARRVPGVNGLSWHVRYDDGTDADDAEIAAATAELVAASSIT